MKKYIIILSVVAIAAAAYLYAFGNPFKSAAAPADPGAPGTGAKDTTSPGGNFKPAAAPVQDANGFPLMEGSAGQYVKNIQTALNTRFGSELVVDGVFGPKTAKALSAHGFNPDAIYYKHYSQIIGG